MLFDTCLLNSKNQEQVKASVKKTFKNPLSIQIETSTKMYTPFLIRIKLTILILFSSPFQ